MTGSHDAVVDGGKGLDQQEHGHDAENEPEGAGNNGGDRGADRVRKSGDPEEVIADQAASESKPEQGKSAGEAGPEPVGVYHGGHGMIASAAAVSVAMAAVLLFPPERGVLRAVVMLAGYPFVAGLFYLAYGRWGRWLGAPPRLGEAGLALALAAWFLLFSGDVVLQTMAFWLGQTALLVCGVSVGGGLAVVAARRRLSLWQAVRSVMTMDREMASRAWAREERL